MKTLVAGHVTHDHYEEGFVAGGCAFYGAQVHHKLDLLARAARARSPGSDLGARPSRSCGARARDDQTHLVGVVGDDFVCDGAIAHLDHTIRRAGKTTTFANYYPPNQPRVQLLEAQAPEVTPDVAPDGWLDADLVHLAPVLQEIDLLKWKEAVGDGLLAINIQGWIKVAGPQVDPGLLEQTQARGVSRPACRVVQEPWTVTVDDLEGVDVACLSEEDVIDQPGLLDKLIYAVPIVAHTLGEKGSRIYVDEEPTEVGIYETEVVDPTGAGDVFAATLTHMLASGEEPVEAARYASAASSIVVEDIGARALERLDEIGERMQEVSVFP